MELVPDARDLVAGLAGPRLGASRHERGVACAAVKHCFDGDDRSVRSDADHCGVIRHHRDQLLHGLKAGQRPPELDASLNVFDRQVEDALHGAGDHRGARCGHQDQRRRT